jgi:DnaD/phage-associated family protein
MKAFSGFPAGQLAYTPLPDLFFSELLPVIDDLAELKLTLHVFWLLSRRKKGPSYVTLRELLGDGRLLRSLQGWSSSPEQALRGSLEKAVARGTLLCLTASEGDQRFYFANSAEGRRAFDQARSGEIELAPGIALAEPVMPLERPNIFVLYEQNIGLLQPMIAEELQDAERTYPQQWIEEAFHIAVENNVRNWKYVRRILERWAAEGKDTGRGSLDEKSWYEEYGKYIKR